MKITSGHTLSRVTRQFEITDDQPVVGMAYSRPPKKVRVYSGVIEYTWKGGAWIVINERAVNLRGIVLKKDGSESANSHSRHPIATSNWMALQLQLADEFAWLQPVIDLLRPTGELSMMTLAGTKVTP